LDFFIPNFEIKIDIIKEKIVVPKTPKTGIEDEADIEIFNLL